MSSFFNPGSSTVTVTRFEPLSSHRSSLGKKEVLAALPKGNGSDGDENEAGTGAEE